MSTQVRLTLITRQGCHLCADMDDVARAVAAACGADYEVRDVDADPALRAPYDAMVPVLLINGRRAFKYRVTEGALRRRLAAERRRARSWLWRRLLGRSP